MNVQQNLAAWLYEQAAYRNNLAMEHPDDAFRNERSGRSLRALAEWLLQLPEDDLRLLTLDSMQPDDVFVPAASLSRHLNQFGFHREEPPEGFPAVLDLILEEEGREANDLGDD